jgi:hypothetical protein
MDDSDLFGDVELMDILPLIVMGVVEEAPKHSNILTSSGEGVLSGNDYLNELLNCNNPARIYGVLRMKRKTFLDLCLVLQRKGLLKDSRNVTIEQQVAQFLWVINYSASIALTAERFRLSKEPISRFYIILFTLN